MLGLGLEGLSKLRGSTNPFPDGNMALQSMMVHWPGPTCALHEKGTRMYDTKSAHSCITYWSILLLMVRLGRMIEDAEPDQSSDLDMFDCRSWLY